MKGYNSTHTGEQLDKAIDYMLNHEKEVQDGIESIEQAAETKKEELESVSQARMVGYDNSKSTETDPAESVMRGVTNVQDALDKLATKGVRSIEFVVKEGGSYVRYYKLDGDVKEVPLNAVHVNYIGRTGQTAKNVQEALIEMFDKIDGLEKLSELRRKICSVNEEGWFVVDELGNIGIKIDENGFDSANLSEHIKSLLGETGASEIKKTYDKGFFIIDENLNIGFKVDENIESVDSKNVNYNNTKSKLNADNVQDAIDELQKKYENNTININSIDGTVGTALANPIEIIKYEVGLAAIFRTWGFIGDSLCSGEMAYNGFRDLYEYSWGQFLCRMCGATGYNYSHSGETAERWNAGTSDRQWTQLKKDGAKQAYIVAMGANQLLPLGDANTDIGEYTASTGSDTNAMTFAGQYAGILQRLQSLDSDSIIFCVTLPVGDKYSGSGKNTVIRNVASKFSNTYIIDLERYAKQYNSKDFRDLYFLNDHMSPAGYLYTAYMFMNYIDWIIRKNPVAFQKTALWNNF